MKTILGRLSARKRGLAGIALALALLFGVLSFALLPIQAHAASWGCEHNVVQINGSTYYACITNARPCLKVRDLIHHNNVIGCLTYHTTIYVYGQYSFPIYNAAGSDIWDGIKGGGVVSDAYVNTSNFDALSPPIPSCQVIGAPGWIGGSCS